LDCIMELNRSLAKCAEISDPTSQAQCVAAAKKAYDECLSDRTAS
jgi:hypothetical protein